MMDLTTYARFALALIFVIGLILVIAWGMRRFGIGAQIAPNTRGRRRLQVVEVAPLDARHKLVMVRRDDIEHVLLIGQGDPIVVERGIGAAAARGSFAQHLQAERSE
jgi:flagellar protein FliO/FliZ